MLKHCFTSGLHPDIKADVLSFRPVDLNEAIGLAFLQEEKHLAQPKLSSRPALWSGDQFIINKFCLLHYGFRFYVCVSIIS